MAEVNTNRSDQSTDFELTIQLKGNGSGFVTRTPDAVRYQDGSVVSLKATAAPGSKFVGWGGDVQGSHFVCNLRLRRATSVTAEFVQVKTFGLAVDSTGSGSGVIDRYPLAGDYVDGTQVALTARANAGTKFKCWHGAATGQSPNCTVTMDAPKSVLAEFVALEYFALTLTLAGTGAGSIDRSYVAATYLEGSLITLTAIAKEGSKFNRWHGAASGQSLTCTITMDSAKAVSAEFIAFEFFTLVVTTTGTGSGIVTPSPKLEKHFENTQVTLTARSTKGSRFVGWHGDTSGRSATCSITMDSNKAVSAEFFALESFPLEITATGTGFGRINRDTDLPSYLDGTKVTLTALAEEGSVFNGWHGDVDMKDDAIVVTVSSAFSIQAEFVALETFLLRVNATGTGIGSVGRSFDSPKYFAGTEITLTATAKTGSRFKRWLGDASGQDTTCIVTINSLKSVSAEFVALESFSLDVTETGTGRGRIDRSIDSPSYFADTEVTLTALAEEGSIFNGWHGDVTMMDESIVVTMSSSHSISAEFVQLAIADTEISAELVSTTRSEVKRGQTATVFRLKLRNSGEQQLRIKIPLTNYVSQSGQTSEQSSWAAGLINGSKGVTLSAGTFSEIGLVHFTRPAKGDRLFVNVEQIQLSARISFIFQCAGDWDDFLLISASLENLGGALGSKGNNTTMASALKRIESLENNLAEVLRRLDAIQLRSPMAGRYIAPIQAGPVQTLSEVWAWVAEHERIGVAELRARLLPLDLLPGAAMDELNERALDLTGEIALAQVGDEVVVTSVIFDEVLANWDMGLS